MILNRDDLEILKCLNKNFKSITELSNITKKSPDTIRRSIGILKDNGLIETNEDTFKEFKLDEFGKKYSKEEFPEEKLANALDKPKTMLEFNKKFGKTAGIYIGIGKKNNLIKITDGKIVLTKKIDIERYKKIREGLKEIGQNKVPKNLELILKIPKLINTINRKKVSIKINKSGENIQNTKPKTEINELTQNLLRSGEWKNTNFKKYNINSKVEPTNAGKFQAYKRFLDLIRKKLIAMGFNEMESPLITNEFYNFDVLFQPQNHPARTWADTYALKTPAKGDLPHKDIVLNTRNAHQDGGNTESKGWGYKWNPEIAKKMMPAAQGTAASAKKMIDGIEIPGRYFAISRVYRPDVLDATHLNEFNQLEGFVVAKDISFKHLLGLLAKFAKEIAGAEDIIFYPDYYPFTEPSVQMSAKHPKLGWVELGGAGIFRPEITENLGIKERVIAWGLGIDRLAMFNLGIHDIRELYSNKLDWLRDKTIVEKI